LETGQTDLAAAAKPSVKLDLADLEGQNRQCSRFCEDQIIDIIQEHEAKHPVADLSHKHDVRHASVYKWKTKYGWMDVS
jgi:hypothetical protein